MKTRTVRPLVDNGDGTHSVPLTRSQVAIISSESAALVGEYNWVAIPSRTGYYAITWTGGAASTCQSMHRMVMGAGPNQKVDHRDHNTLHNTIGNLRPATNRQNQQNRLPPKNSRSGLKGVSRDKRDRRWRATITLPGGKRKSLGGYVDKFDAARAYDKAALELFGEFACTNAQVMDLPASSDEVPKERKKRSAQIGRARPQLTRALPRVCHSLADMHFAHRKQMFEEPRPYGFENRLRLAGRG